MKKLRLPLALLLGLMATSCSKVYYSPDSRALANSEKSIAILPPAISIAATRKIDGEALKEQQRTESVNFQNQMYSWLLKRRSQGTPVPELQDISVTTTRLRRAGYPETPMTNEEICDLLDVDAILISNYALAKPMSEGAAVALAVLGGYYGQTNSVNVTLSIVHSANQKMIFNYQKKVSGSLGSNPAMLVDRVMRQASREMPYTRRPQ